MSTLISYNGLSVVSPAPSGAGGEAINENFKKLSTHIAASNPTASDDSSRGFGVGSRWITNTSNVEWLCTNATAGAATWVVLCGRAQPVSAPPANPVAGQMYFDTTSRHFFGWNGSSWKQLDN